ncbi:MAG: helix-turn-helix domain-containing protein [Enterococcus italicus]|uniref:helix-turn-helix domain-containing protein n=1 Tax=Enterococcus italicus TaxID=246144 RepID=UPI003992354A
MSIGENLKVLRKKAKKNQTKFAKDIGISRTYLSDLEHNRKSLSIDTIEKIAKKIKRSCN